MENSVLLLVLLVNEIMMQYDVFSEQYLMQKTTNTAVLAIMS